MAQRANGTSRARPERPAMVGFNMQGSTRVLFYGGLAVLQTQSIFQATPANWVCMLLNRSQFLKRKPDRPTDSENENTLWQNMSIRTRWSLGSSWHWAWHVWQLGVRTGNVKKLGLRPKTSPWLEQAINTDRDSKAGRFLCAQSSTGLAPSIGWAHAPFHNHINELTNMDLTTTSKGADVNCAFLIYFTTPRTSSIWNLSSQTKSVTCLHYGLRHVVWFQESKAHFPKATPEMEDFGSSANAPQYLQRPWVSLARCQNDAKWGISLHKVLPRLEAGYDKQSTAGVALQKVQRRLFSRQKSWTQSLLCLSFATIWDHHQVDFTMQSKRLACASFNVDRLQAASCANLQHTARMNLEEFTEINWCM